MKRAVWFVAAAFALFTATISAQKSAMSGGDHDLRTTGNTGDLCIACHTPHNANPDAAALLWNRAIRNNYATYDSTVNPDFKGGVPDLNVGGKASLLCLSCHDGAVALNTTFNGSLGSGYKSTLGSGTNLGTDLKNDHPIGFSYATSATAKPTEIVALASLPTTVKLFGADSRMECSSCHEVHGSGSNSFLRIANTNSALCLTCHK